MMKTPIYFCHSLSFYGGKCNTSFLLAIFGSARHHRKKTDGILETLFKFWFRNMHVYAKHSFQNLTFDLALIWPSSKVKLDDGIASNDHHYRYLQTKVLRNMCGRVCLSLFLFSDFLWPGLDLFKNRLCTNAGPSLHTSMWQHFGRVWALCGTSSQPEGWTSEINVFFLPLTWH